MDEVSSREDLEFLAFLHAIHAAKENVCSAQWCWIVLPALRVAVNHGLWSYLFDDAMRDRDLLCRLFHVIDCAADVPVQIRAFDEL